MSASISDPSTIRCRPHPGLWFFALLALAFGALSWFVPDVSQTPDSRLAGAIVGMVFGGLGLGMLTWLFTVRVEADAGGLRWRTFRGTRSVTWSGITDYYEPVPRGSGSNSRSVVETAAGRLTDAEGLWTDVEAFRATVRERATSAKVRDWGIQGARPEDDWPKAFSYNMRKVRREMAVPHLLPWIVMVAWVATEGAGLLEVARQDGWGAAFALFVLLFLLAFIALSSGLAITIFREAQRRAVHRITVDPDGIACEDGQRRVASPWSGVNALRIVHWGGTSPSAVFVVATEDGDISFVREIDDVFLLRAAVERFTGKTFAMDEAGDRLTPPTAEEKMGLARVYTYRNRTVRALLWFPTAMSFMMLTVVTLSRMGRIEGQDDPLGILLGVLTGAFAAWGWWRYRAVSIRTDALGITWTGPGRRVFIPWSDIRACKARKSDMATFTTIRGSKEKIYVWCGILGYESLKAEIEARAPALSKTPGRSSVATR